MNKTIDELAYSSMLSFSKEEKKRHFQSILNIARKESIYPCSIYNLYQAMAKNKVTEFTVPAINLRTLTYDTARIIFRLALAKNIGAFIFEIARSEIEYTNQRPDEYTTSILAAAIKEGYKGLIFLQGDHFQINARAYYKNPEEETQNVKLLIKEAINASFYNIDIDASTLVNKEQKNNFEVTADLTNYIRSLEPKNMPISVGGEIGQIGEKNSTAEDLEAFMKGYLSLIKGVGISKVSVQAGTTHGGVPLPDGTLAPLVPDFSLLKTLGNIARTKYHLGGVVAHGASTLPIDMFNKFVEAGVIEVHLSTGLQNTVYENLPKDLKNEMYQWLKENVKNEWKKEWSEKQFLYKTRKKALGPFKKRLWQLSRQEKKPILLALEEKLSLIFDILCVSKTKDLQKITSSKN